MQFLALLVVACTFEYGASSTVPFNLVAWRGAVPYGVDYYPEAWPKHQWATDAQMMQAAGVNLVRLAEFAWHKMEPRAGQFDFSWLDAALTVLNAHGIKAILGTPTASPPQWFYQLYPHTQMQDPNGIVYRQASRGNINHAHPDFLDATERIVVALAKHYANHTGVLGFQIDNEVTGNYDFSPLTVSKFQEWLERKYKTLAALNDAWGTIFWGHTYDNWKQIPLPWVTMDGSHNPSLALDYYRFNGYVTSDYVLFQHKLLSTYAPSKAVTTNMMGGDYTFDRVLATSVLQWASWDNYPGQMSTDYNWVSYNHAMFRGLKQQNFMVMEQQGGCTGWQQYWSCAPPPLLRVWAYQSIANGADGLVFFRWRTSRYGTEQHWEGILDQDSYPNARYDMLAQLGAELQTPALLSAINGSRVQSRVACLFSKDSYMSLIEQPIVPGGNLVDNTHYSFFEAFRGQQVMVDHIYDDQVEADPTALSRYSAVITSALIVVSDLLATRLEQYASADQCTTD